MDFLKLRLTGFKSFVDPTELLIDPGLTGIVGPNGCGKSNLVEALRWVMGENSARRMRGGEMDDVIFGGTAKRPPRNIAEVGLLLDNRNRTAPAAFNDATDLEVSRRIERGCGSDYRINGKTVRARDVQLLFADHATGASSPALVSQGRVGALIAAKPHERRQLLEDAAGISGLHSRRHEAELRLKNAEANLTRLDDVIGAMEAQLQGLKKQARQAARYRNLSEQIRRAEAVVWHLRWLAAEAETVAARGQFAEVEDRVRALMLSVTQLTTRHGEAAATLPDLRQTEAASAAALQRLVLAKDGLEAELRRVGETQETNRRRLEQIKSDLERERSLAGDAETALERIAAERGRIVAAQGLEADQQADARESVVLAQDTVDELDAALTELTETVAQQEAQHGALTRHLQEQQTRAATLARRLQEQTDQRAKLLCERDGIGGLDDAELAVERAEAQLEDVQEAAEQAEALRAEMVAQAQRERDRLDVAQAKTAELRAERDGLRRVLAAASDDRFPPMIDAIVVAPGTEAALAAAMGDGLDAALDVAAPVHWRDLPALPSVAPLPAGSTPLSDHVDGPAALARCLAHIGLVEDADWAHQLAGDLLPGQSLVSRDGAAFRWDGLTMAAGAPTRSAVRLQQRNRLEELEAAVERAETEAEAVRERSDGAKRAAEDAAAREKECLSGQRQALARLGDVRQHLAELLKRAEHVTSRLTVLDETIVRLHADCDEADAAVAATRDDVTALPETGTARDRMADVRSRLTEQRTVLASHRNTLDTLLRDAQGRRRRLETLAEEARSWDERRSGADGRLAELRRRAEAAEAELASLADRPEQIRGEQQELLSRIAEAERKRTAAADQLAEMEAQVTGTERDLRKAEAALSDAREQRARAEAAVAAALQAEASLTERIEERLGCRPQEALAAAEIDSVEDLPEIKVVETRLEKLSRERDAMGPVNLRAEMEASELEQQVDGLQTERTDLVAAIGRLRQGINALNREARERLLASFQLVNKHFQTLFQQLFGGGRAQLELTDAEDPLAAGLEIYASPPGKKLQVLSLLSGGEQALTAMALIFAVFQTNPSPICVLDEVDAPLDEANVGRFCTLLDEMTRTGATRFLIITHHRMTMARVDRLYGVTMGEQGVSQLVSVDLRGAEALRAVG